MQDQLIIFMGLASGESSMLCSEPTLHTRTAIEIVQQLLPTARFSVTTVDDPAGCSGESGGVRQLYMIRCQGAGLTAS